MFKKGICPIVSLRDSFTGKEYQGPDFSVPYTDFGARHYGIALPPAEGRHISVVQWKQLIISQ